MKRNDRINASVTSLLDSLDMCAHEAFLLLVGAIYAYVPYHSMEI